MYLKRKERFISGYLLSVSMHSIGLFYLIVKHHSIADYQLAPTEVYTVTLEGGDRIGNISQVPLEEEKKKVLPNTNEEQAIQASQQEEAKKLEQAALVAEERKIAEEKVRIAEAEKKKEAEKRKAEELKKLEDKKKADAEKKEKEKLDKKAAEEAKAKEKKRRDDLLKRAISKASTYKGESANAGGEGLGAARLGGKGMGGGTPASMEFILYRNALEQQIKSGWRWLPGDERFVCQVEFSILPDGTVQSASIVSDSGNPSFDESALRAVYKASPVPTPPEKIYDQFRRVKITFDSER